MNIHSLKMRTVAPMIIPIIILLIGLSILSINKIKNILTKQAYSNLTTSRDIKKQQIEDFFNRSVADIEILSKSTCIGDLINTLDNLDRYLNAKPNKSYSFSNPLIKKSIAPYETFLQNYTNRYGYIDILLISAQSGRVRYTQAKASNFGEDLKNGRLKDSPLSEVWKKVKALKRVVFVDMKPYLPYENKPTIFMGAPIYKNSELKSILVFQISDHSISKIMNFKNGYKKSQTDQLIGGDKPIMKNGKRCAATYSLRASVSDPKIGRCNTKVSELALCNKEGEELIIECNKERVLSSYTPVNLGPDLNWAIISEINEKEVLRVPNSIKNSAIRDFLILTSIIISIIIFFIYKEFKYEKREKKKNQEMNETLQIRVGEEVVKNREQQELLFHQSKMASMGEMIGNIAHQWRQPLNALSALNVGLAMRYNAGKLSDSEMLRFKEKSNHLIQRMSDTIDDFRNFFYPNKSVEVFRVDNAIDEAINFIKGSYAINNIKIINYTGSKLEIRNHKNELIQVLLNIFNNSKDAIKEFNSQNGVVIVDVIESQKWVKITIQDNGGGIKQDIINRVFEPYFTTKFKDDGTGIGLYMSKMIVEESMQGKLKIENRESGVLTTIKLPIN